VSKSNTFENDLLLLTFNATAIANIADNMRRPQFVRQCMQAARMQERKALGLKGLPQ
jgi:hypothetical protein